MRSRALLVVLVASLCAADFGVYEDEGVDETDDSEVAAELDEAELSSIDKTVEGLADQFTEQVKHHIQEQIKAQKLSKSKFAQSKVAVQVSPLHIAAANNQYETVAKLLGNGADPNTQTPAGMTPLHSAAEQGFKDIVDLMLAHNASVNAVGPHGVTPLHLASHRGRFSVTEILIREGADIDARAGSFEYSPLYFASEMGHTRIVAALLAANASTELQAHDGSTALHVASREGHEAVVQQLVDAGAHVDAPDHAQTRPLQWASALGHSDVIELLLAAGATAITPDEEDAFRDTGTMRVEIKPFLQFPQI